MRQPFPSHHQSGFSLIELMIVVGIIGVLATLALPRFQQFQAKAKMGEARNMLSHIYTLEQSYHLDNNDYQGFARYGRLAGGALNCNAPGGAQQIGFQLNPCDANNPGPVPRYGYEVNRINRSQFRAIARSGNGDSNLVCPGSQAHWIRIDQSKAFDESHGDNALSSCF
jgi:prepilin-type N-terminal cleavage/methylation domain-containing protein